MRVPALFLVLLLAIVGTSSESRAEKVKTNQSTSLLSRPGERGKVFLTIPTGKVMTVLAKDGRWLKVRVMGRTGWVPRSKVDVSDEIARNTRRRPFVDGRGKGRGFGGEEGPDDRIGADAIGGGVEPNTDEGDEGGGKTGGGKTGGGKTGGGKTGGGGEDEGDEGGGDEGEDGDTVIIDEEEPTESRPTARVKAKIVALAEPSEEADESFAATPGMVLYPTGNKQGKYTEVENDDGDLGYVPTSSLEIEEPAGEVEGGGEGGGPAKKRQIDARARLGVTLLSQSSSKGGGVSTSALTLALGAGYLMPYKAKLMIGGELTYDYAKAIPGIKNPDGMGTTSIGLHNLRLRALGGYDMKKSNGMTLFGRLGFHYQSYQVSNVGDLTKNKAKLPSEIIRAPALGFGIAIPQLTKKIGLRASLDAILFSSVSQTKGLEDGAGPSARGALLEAGMTYRWKKDLDILVTYDLTYFSMSFGAAVAGSARPMGGGNVSRGDQFHAFTLGIGKGF
jgi:uncharacterized protein YgiM (DUF1202 family)